MRRIRRTRTTVETQERLIISQAQGSLGTGCPVCGRGVEMLSAESAALILGIPVRNLYRRVEEGSVHFIESPGGSLLVCPKSISKT